MFSLFSWVKERNNENERLNGIKREIRSKFNPWMQEKVNEKIKLMRVSDKLVDELILSSIKKCNVMKNGESNDVYLVQKYCLIQ